MCCCMYCFCIVCVVCKGLSDGDGGLSEKEFPLGMIKSTVSRMN